MYANYHSHTFRCGHAHGTEREYIENAIRAGIRIMGFSEHVPFLFPGGFQSEHRMRVEQTEEYFSVLNRLKAEYQNEIELHIGFESEYYPRYFKDMLAFVRDTEAEYLLLGQHFIRNELPPEGMSSYHLPHGEDDLKEYTHELCEAINTGVFTYAAHPDLLRYRGSEEVCRRCARDICREAKNAGLPLEINFLGIREKREYPNPLFWEIAGEEGCEVIYGFDAHAPEAAGDLASLPAAEKLRREYALPLLEEVPLLRP